MDMDNPKIKEMVEKLVQDILAGKASAGASAELETIFGKASQTIEELKEEVSNLRVKAEEQSTAVEDLEQAKSELETEVSALKEQVETLITEKQELEERASVAEGTLEDMAKDKVADDRMAELSGLSVARVDEEAFATQKALIREMSDEDFVAYRDERVAMREELAATFKTEDKAEKPKSDAEVEDDTPDEQAQAGSDSDNDSVGDDVTPPADIDGALENASAAVPNAVSPAGDAEWKQWGKALAKFMEDSRGEEPENK